MNQTIRLIIKHILNMKPIIILTSLFVLFFCRVKKMNLFQLMKTISFSLQTCMITTMI